MIVQTINNIIDTRLTILLNSILILDVSNLTLFTMYLRVLSNFNTIDVINDVHIDIIKHDNVVLSMFEYVDIGIVFGVV